MSQRLKNTQNGTPASMCFDLILDPSFITLQHNNDN